MKSKIALLVVFLCVSVLSVGTASAQASAAATSGTDVAYAEAPSDASSGEAAGPWIATSGLAPEVAQVREAVDKFSRNFELKDVDRLKSESWPSMSPKAYRQLKNTFAVLSEITLKEDCMGVPVIVFDSADWACKEKFGYQLEGRPRYMQTHALQFHLKKVGGTWFVEGRTAAGR